MKTFSNSLDLWLSVACLDKKPKTQKFYREVHSIISKVIPDGNIQADSITPELLLQIAQKLAHCCPSRWNTFVMAMRFITPEAKCLHRRPLRMRQFSPPNQLQFSGFLKECDSQSRSKAGLIVRFLAFTGMRIGEAQLLRWADVKDDRIDVPGEITKNGKPRSIPLLRGVDDTIERLMCLDHHGYVLPRQNARKAIDQACRRAGVSRMSFHSFRHLFATRCIQSGVDLPTVARWLGHSDGGALLSRCYYHLVDDHSRTMAARVVI